MEDKGVDSPGGSINNHRWGGREGFEIERDSEFIELLGPPGVGNGGVDVDVGSVPIEEDD